MNPAWWGSSFALKMTYLCCELCCHLCLESLRCPCVHCHVPAVTIGHETVMGRATFFSGVPPVDQQFDFDREYPFLEELTDTKTQVSLHSYKCVAESIEVSILRLQQMILVRVGQRAQVRTEWKRRQLLSSVSMLCWSLKNPWHVSLTLLPSDLDLILMSISTSRIMWLYLLHVHVLCVMPSVRV